MPAVAPAAPSEPARTARAAALSATRKNTIPPVSLNAGIETPQFWSMLRPRRLPATMPKVATAKVHQATRRIVVSSSPRVRCTNGPSTFSGPSVTKRIVNISPQSDHR